MFDLLGREGLGRASDGDSASLASVRSQKQSSRCNIYTEMLNYCVINVGLHVNGHMPNVVQTVPAADSCVLFSLLLALVACVKDSRLCFFFSLFSANTNATCDVVHFSSLSFNVECHSIFQINIVNKGFVADGAVRACVCVAKYSKTGRFFFF